ncbi:TetR/AcrR family transcriptional regulator [Streptomyces noursei]|uniref:TetR/AcrR family transcriptional regulator n=1 Tax=Streptomyces noursei TaxID=1971 RepID=UPI00331D9EF9
MNASLNGRTQQYHHGDLRRALLNHAAAAISESGVAKVSLREIARRAGVSHAAPTHHFGSREGLLTALAAQGFHALADLMHNAQEHTADFAEMGVAYVQFALSHPAHFEVMFQPHLHQGDDPALRAAQQRAGELLYGAPTLPGTGTRDAGIAAWSLVHGFATLWLSNALPAEQGTPPEQRARQAIRAFLDGRDNGGLAANDG